MVSSPVELATPNSANTKRETRISMPRARGGGRNLEADVPGDETLG